MSKSPPDLNAKLRELEETARRAHTVLTDAAGLEQWRTTFLGRKSELASLMSRLGTLPPTKRGEIGQIANAVKNRLMALGRQLPAGPSRSAGHSAFAASLPGAAASTGREHPLTLITRRIVEIFRSMGYEAVSGPEVEETRLNFDLLNIPVDHPARDLWDTYYLTSQKSRPPDRPENQLLLRTHTSPVQVRTMLERRPPVRIIVPGRVFRH